MHDVLHATPRMWSGRSNCKNHHSHTWATARASRSVVCLAKPPSQSEWSLYPTIRIVFSDSTMSYGHASGLQGRQDIIAVLLQQSEVVRPRFRGHMFPEAAS